MRYLAPISVCLLLLIEFAKEGPSPSDFVGAERCKLCHRAIYQTWAGTAHRRATETVHSESDPAVCLRCHATGPPALPGVQCEACHGPGSNYSTADVMIDPEKARQAGLVQPSESVCRTCHYNSGLPNHSPQFSMPEGDEWPDAVH